MATQLNFLIEDLKSNNQDYEFYPSTEDMVRCVYDSCKKNYGVSSVLDIGCGTCNFLTYWKKFSAEEDRYCGLSYFVMEKSGILLERLPKEAIVLGTDFETNSIIDKPVDAIFCNPPYSKYVEWTCRIIAESNCNYIYLIIPQRWKDNAEIQSALQTAKLTAVSLNSFDFLDAERQARAKVDVVYIDNRCRPRNNAFDSWFDSCFPMEDRKAESEYEYNCGKARELKDKIVSAENKVEMLTRLYDEDLNTLQRHFKAITNMDADILESINVNKSTVREALKNKIAGLKSRYWREVFDNLPEITSRLTSDTREKFYERYQDILSVDFNYDNIYALLLWVCKNASSYYDEQLIEWFKTFTSPDNIMKYKSNQRVFKLNEWYGGKRFDSSETVSHYCLSYRIVCDHSLFQSGYSWEGKFNNMQSRSVIDDLCVLANNLGFMVGKKEYPSAYGEKFYVYGENEKPLIEYKIYKNGNTHFKLDKEFCKAMNVEVSRLLGWIQNKEDILKEFPDELAEGAERYFGTSVSLIGSATKLLK